MVLVTTQLSFAEDGPDCAAEMGARLAFFQGITDVGLSEDPNMVFSPASMDGLFALIGPGYNDDLQGALTSYFGQPLEQVASQMSTLSETTEGIRVTSAMNLFIDQEFQPSVNQGYVDFVTGMYGFEPSILDFSDAEATAQKVNDWAAENTKNDEGVPLITEVIKPDFVTDDMVMILTNALYFKGEWASEFREGNTSDQPFTTSEGKSIEVATMGKWGESISMSYIPQGELGEHGEAGVIAVELPFKGHKFSMIVAMAANRYSFPAEDEWTGAVTTYEHAAHMPASQVLDEYISTGIMTDPGQRRFQSQSLNVFQMPKFEVESELKDLENVLMAAGLGGLLSSNVLSNLSDAPRLKLAKILQKALFKVDEKGGEGAAVSVGGAVLESSLAPGPPQTNVLINGEFAFSVVNNETGAVLFQGVIGDPSAEK